MNAHIAAQSPTFATVRDAYFLDEVAFDPLTAVVRKGYLYWKSKVRDGRFPARSDIDPLEIPALLKGIMLIDVEGGADNPRFRFRLMGANIVHVSGGNYTGMCFDEVPALRGDSGNTIGMYREMMIRRRPHYWVREYIDPRRSYCSYERVLCPLSRDGERIDMLIGFMSPIAE